MPAEQALQSVHVLEELPAQPGLADASYPGHLHEMRPAIVSAREKEVLHQLELPLAPDERRLKPFRFHATANAGHDAVGLPQMHGFSFALQRMHANVPVRYRGISRALRGLAHEHAPGLRRRLDARGGVDEIPGHHPLPGGAQVHCRFAGEDTSPRPQLGRGHLTAELGHRVDDIERRSDRALRIVLPCYGRSPHRHHGVANEFLDHAAVTPHYHLACVEVPGEKFADFLRIARFRQRREAHEVGEEHRYMAALCARREGRSSRACGGPDIRLQAHGWRGRRRDKWLPAIATEPRPGGVGSAAARARHSKRGSAVAAEPPPILVFTATVGAGHRRLLLSWWGEAYDLAPCRAIVGCLRRPG